MKIGLALGAGAARGWTHIGIIQALEKLEKAWNNHEFTVSPDVEKINAFQILKL